MSAQATNVSVVNGVDVSQFTEVVKAVEADPSLGMCHFRARNTWMDGAHNQVSIQGFYAAGGEDTSRQEPFVHDADEPPLLVGENRGANPVEYVLTALSGCLTTTLVYYAATMGINLDAVESTLEGDLDIRGLFDLSDKVRNGYQNIRVTYRIESDAPREKIEELVRIAQRFSPVFDIVSNPVPVTVELAA
jgi:uncharacterized OsmC-like protein